MVRALKEFAYGVTKGGLTEGFKALPSAQRYLAPHLGKFATNLFVESIGAPVANYIKGKLSSKSSGRLSGERVMKYRRRNVRRRNTRRGRRVKRGRSNRARRRPLSQYHENTTDYVRGRRSRRSGSFNKRVLRAIVSESPIYQLTRQKVDTASWASGKLQVFGTMMYQVAVTATVALGPTMKAGDDSDILKMFDFLNNTLAAPAAASVYQSRKLYVRSGHLELYITNTTATSSIEVEAYEIVSRKSYDELGDNIADCFFDTFAETTAATGATTAFNDPSVTVFQNSSFCKLFAVVRKTSHLIEPNKTIRLQMSSNKSFVYEGADLQSEGLCLKRARGMFFMTKTMPASGSAFPAGSVAWGYTKRYRFQQPSSYGQIDLLANL